ncbi:50S ribosomal protein L22 [bacterium]|nr:50S ribosomal protein L22 [bacterium]
MEAKAIAKNLRITPRKVRLIIDLIRGKNIKKAFSILNNVNKLGTNDVFKVVKSAFYNAVNKKMNSDKLYIHSIFASDGIKMKRFIPRAKGSSSSKIKRTSNVTVIIKEK